MNAKRTVCCITLAIAATALLLVSCAGRRPAPRRGEEGKVVTHRVEPGETWETIAEHYYHERGRADELALYNGESGTEPPVTGSGIRVPLYERDLRRMRHTLDAARMYNEGHRLAGAGDYAAAVEAFRGALEMDPRFHDAAYNLAATYQKLGLHSNAITVLNDLITGAPPHADYHHAMGASLFHTGNYRQAYEAFTEALAIDPNHSKAAFSIAAAAEKLGETDRARELYRRYIENFPGGVWADEARQRLESLPR